MNYFSIGNKLFSFGLAPAEAIVFCAVRGYRNASNTSIADVHNRMPLVLPKDDVSPWLQNTATAVQILNRAPPLLVKQPVA